MVYYKRSDEEYLGNYLKLPFVTNGKTVVTRLGKTHLNLHLSIITLPWAIG